MLQFLVRRLIVAAARGRHRNDAGLRADAPVGRPRDLDRRTQRHAGRRRGRAQGLRARPAAGHAVLRLGRPRRAPATWATATSSRRRVSSLIGERMPITLTLGLTGLVIALVVSLPLGILAAVRENTAFDRAVQMVALLGQAMPSFWLGLLLMITLGLQLGWLPISGTGSWQHYVMPGIVLAFSAIPALTRLTRAGMIQAMGSRLYPDGARQGPVARLDPAEARAAQRRHPGGGDRRRPARLHAGRLDRDRAGLRPARRRLPRLGEHRQERLPGGPGGRAGAGGDLCRR